MSRLDTLTKRIARLKQDLDAAIQQRQEVCPHNSVERSGGGIWHDWPLWGYSPYAVECLDCGLTYWSNDDANRDRYRELDKKVVRDKALYITAH